MGRPVYVDVYSGYKAHERPRQFTLDEQIYEIAAVLVVGTNHQRRISKFRAPKERRICFGTTKPLISGRYKAASMAMSCWRRPWAN
jgi:hypothetical protein